ncbi:MAG: spermidine synthase [Planctomycetaceae bacterium]|nr:spermidine synthase [Planctomycetaceae bacterium]
MPDERSPAPSEYPLKPGDPNRLGAGPAGSPRGELPPPVGGDKFWPVTAKRSRSSDFLAMMGCNAIVFGTSVCLMVLELTASRLIAGYVGQSLYTWTSVIGVVLAGISLGNYAGGWLADRFAPHKLLGWQFLLAGLLTLSVLLLNTWAANTPRPENVHWQWWVMLVVAWVFLAPALALGTISPVVANMAIKRSVKTGITVGNIYAWGALGSIVGTFLTGFWLIGAFGTREIICMTAGTLLLMGVFVAAGQWAFRSTVLLGVLPFVVLIGVCSSTTAEGMARTCRNLAGVRSLWSTAEHDFRSDEEALQKASDEKDAQAIVAANARREWRTARLGAEENWKEWGSELGAQLHRLGMTLGLRSDDPDEYYDESDYYAINIFDAKSTDGDQNKQLRLDFLLHSYYNPENPTKLYYDYEQVYAAITERAAEGWNRVTAVTLQQLPVAGDLAASIPKGVEYEPTSGRLSIRGGMTIDQLRTLLAIGPDAEFNDAILSIWQQGDRDWRAASHDGKGMMFVPLDELPSGVDFPPALASRLHYDSVMKALICTKPISLVEALALVAHGDEAGFAARVAELYVRSRRTSTMFIGGGGFVFPRWIESRFVDHPLIDVAEIDPAVQAAVEQEMGLPREFGPPAEGKTYVKTTIGDARKFVDDRLRENVRLAAAGATPVTYDFVYGDAFNDLSVPWHLTTLEFSRKIRDLMTPHEGVYLVNIIDICPRTQYPARETRAAAGVVEYTGTIPASLLPVTISSDDFVSVRGPFPSLAISKSGTGYRLRYSSVMTKQVRDALQALGRTESRWNANQFADIVATLYKRTRTQKSLHIAPPARLFDRVPEGTNWVSAAGEFGNLQIRRVQGEGYLYGYRGVMSDGACDRLLSLAPDDVEYATGIRDLQTRSRAEKVGQFLGRYVNTAREVFPFVYVFTSGEKEPTDDRDTFVVACSLRKLDFERLESAGGHWSNGPFAWTESGPDGKPVDKGGMPIILELSRGKILTDDFAPLDNLLAPVFVSRSRDKD